MKTSKSIMLTTKMAPKLISVTALIFFVFVAGLSQADVTFGVQAPRGNAKALKKWSEMGKYLAISIGQPVKIVPLKPNKTVDAVKAGKAQFMLSNPVLAVILNKKNGSTPIATMAKKSGHKFAGVILSKKGSGITNASHLKGKKVMAFKFKKSAAAYVFQVKHLKDQGIDPHKDFALFKEANKQDDIVLAVKKGIIDAGFVKTGLMESMAKEKKISMSDFTIIDQISDDFPLVRSTQLYPSWTVTVAPTVNADVIAKIKSTLLKLSPSDSASKKAKIVRFVEPVDLNSLTNTLKELHLPPFE